MYVVIQFIDHHFLLFINLFHSTDPFLCFLKTSGNQSVSDGFRGYRKKPVSWNGLICSTQRLFNIHKWVKVFKNGPSKICGRQPLKNLNPYLKPSKSYLIVKEKHLGNAVESFRGKKSNLQKKLKDISK